jgi:dTDP-4-dehydrorhamnose reductase
MLGWEIQRAARRLVAGIDWRVAAHPRDGLDITDPDAVQQAIGIVSPAVLINCAAWADVDGCESNEIEALRVNGEAPGRLARICQETGVVLVHFSTDYVFDGTASRPYAEDDPVHPISAYGRSKLAGEVAIRETSAAHLILRTQWLYGSHGRNFVDTILLRAAAGEPLRVVNDQHGAPTYARELAAAMLAAIAKGLRGTYHAVNSGACTWYDVARAALALADMDPDTVTPVPSAAVPRPARRPAWGVLDTTRLERAGVRLSPWREALETYIRKDRVGSAG